MRRSDVPIYATSLLSPLPVQPLNQLLPTHMVSLSQSELATALVQRLQYAKTKSDATAKLDGSFKKEKKQRQKALVAAGAGFFLLFVQ
jgi:hypothetical protein